MLLRKVGVLYPLEIGQVCLGCVLLTQVAFIISKQAQP